MPADPVTISLSPSSPAQQVPGCTPKEQREVMRRILHGIPDQAALEAAKDAAYEADHPRQRTSPPWKARPPMKVQGITHVESVPKAKSSRPRLTVEQQDHVNFNNSARNRGELEEEIGPGMPMRSAL